MVRKAPQLQTKKPVVPKINTKDKAEKEYIATMENIVEVAVPLETSATNVLA
jgi:hypothetical protein